MADEFVGAGVSRRKMIAGVAWSVPVIVGVSATPAVSASSPPPQPAVLVFNYVSAWAQLEGVSLLAEPWYYARFLGVLGGFGVQALYDATAANITSITVTLSVPKAGMVAAAPTIRGAGPLGVWTPVSGTVSGDNVVYTFIWAGSVSPINTTEMKLDYLLPGVGTQVNDAWFPKTVVGVATSPQATTVSKASDPFSKQ